MNPILLAGALGLGLAAATGASAAEPGATTRPSNKWRIQFDETSRTDGTIDFRVLPQGGAPIEVSVPVQARQTENVIARAARDAFRTALGKGYHVETDDGEDVLVKRGRGTQPFGLELVASSAEDVDIDVDRE